MKNSTMLPLFAVTAAAAFGLGWTIRPDASPSSSSTNSADSGKATPSGSSRAAGAGQRTSGASETPQSQFIARYTVGGEISPEDMKAAIKEMSQTNDPLLRQKMFAALLENLTPDNAKEAFLALQENRRGGGPMGRGNDEELRLLANAWGRMDGAGAIASLKEIAAAREEEGGDNNGRGGRGGPGGPGGMMAEMGSVLAGWATVDGAGASAYINGIEDEREQRFAAFGVLQGMLVNGVDGAMGFIQSLPKSEDSGRIQEMYMGMIAGEMIEQGVDQAKGWVDTISDPSLKSGALSRVAMEMMRDDREGAAAWIAEYGDDKAAAQAASRVADAWSREDPQAVIKWADTLAGESKAEAYGEAIGSWAREDPAAAGEFLATMQASPERDSAVESYATRVSREDPATAMEWASTIANDEVRQSATVDVARDWYRKDQAAASEWIQSSGLPEETVKTITDPPRDFRRGFGGGGPGGPGGR